MANFFYGLALQNYSFPAITTDNIKVALVQISGVGTPYTANQATDQYLSIIPGGAIGATSPNLTTKTFTQGLFKADNISFGVVAAGHVYGALVLYMDTGVAGTSPLIVYIDGSGGTWTGLPVTPDGVQNVTVSWAAGGIFQL